MKRRQTSLDFYWPSSKSRPSSDENNSAISVQASSVDAVQQNDHLIDSPPSTSPSPSISAASETSSSSSISAVSSASSNHQLSNDSDVGIYLGKPPVNRDDSVNAKYISASIQNDIILVCGKIITDKIVKQTNDAMCFTIIADEASDVSSHEMLSISVRFVDDSAAPVIREMFLGFVQVEDVSARGLANAIIGFMRAVGLRTEYLRGQAYDGASVMSGKENGVQAIIRREVNEKAMFTHCASHSMNLACTTATSVPPIKACSQLIEKVIFMITRCPKRCTLLKNEIAKSQHKDRHHRLLELCSTRWVERHDAVERFVEVIDAVYKVLLEVYRSKAENGQKAYECALLMANFEFIVSLSVLKKYAVQLSHVASELQQPNADLLECCVRIGRLRVDLADDLKDDDGFRSIYVDALQIGQKLKVAESLPLEVQSDLPLIAYYRDAIYKPYIETLREELRYRFEKHHETVYAMQLLVPAYYDAKQLAKIKAVIEFYQSDLSRDPDSVMDEFQSWIRPFLDKPPAQRPHTAMEALEACKPGLDRNIHKLFKIFCTLPVTSATAERSFSTMKRVKTYLRSTMTDARLGGLALLNIHREIEVDVEEVLRRFFLISKRRCDIGK